VDGCVSQHWVIAAQVVAWQQLEAGGSCRVGPGWAACVVCNVTCTAHVHSACCLCVWRSSPHLSHRQHMQPAWPNTCFVGATFFWGYILLGFEMLTNLLFLAVAASSCSAGWAVGVRVHGRQ
jgi:hypothetical protein